MSINKYRCNFKIYKEYMSIYLQTMTSFERTNYCNHSFSTFKQQHSNIIYMSRNIAKKKKTDFSAKERNLARNNLETSNFSEVKSRYFVILFYLKKKVKHLAELYKISYVHNERQRWRF